ncbi:MAG: inositol monophosphatase family protein [Desulforhabdus sp.]|nr:inositol monophosphatase family protein [Desulforhabdus sp.]
MSNPWLAEVEMLEEMEKVGREAIFQAGDLIRRRIGSAPVLNIQAKGPSDYVTETDRESERLIVDSIRKNFPDHQIMAEESSNIELDDKITWIIDPLDGTTNFIHGFPFVAVSIAVCIKKEIVVGLVLDPIRRELFSARKGNGARLNGSLIRMEQSCALDSALIATGFPFRAKYLLDPYLSTFRDVFYRVGGIRRAGSAALDLAYVSAGRVDGFWEAGLKPWDVAAGSLLIVEAGGQVDDFWGAGRYLQNGHIVAGVKSVHSFLLDQVQKHLAPALSNFEL